MKRFLKRGMLAILFAAGAATAVANWLDHWPVVEMSKYAFAAALAGACLGWRLSRLTRKPKNTVNYTLFKGSKRVYEGVTYFRRLPTRIEEHRQSGKVFSHFTAGPKRTRKQALELEKKRIRRHRPKYNIAHKI